MALRNSPTFTGPIVRQQQLSSGGRDALNAAAELAVVMLDEEARQRQDVLGAFAHGGKHDLDDVEPEIEILAEGVFLDGFAQVLVGGGDHAQVELGREAMTTSGVWPAKRGMVMAWE
jgi:hypothetical protein